MSSLGNNRNLKHRRLDEEYSYFARHTLKIQDKVGVVRPFIFNRAQEHLHYRLEKQLNELGRVRAIILKGRQQGCSTYVGGRFYHKAVRKKGKNVFILSHEAESTSKLFKMVTLFYEESEPALRPKADTANVKNYEFKEINSSYGVGTARNEKIGRGGVRQLFHGSEVAFWDGTEGLETGILQSVADLPETEIILESTANGMGNFFFGKCMEALGGKSDYQLIFIPWYWQDEYQRKEPADGDLSITEEELEYQKLYKVSDEQIYWRRAKIIEFGKGDFKKGLWKFRQEYPAHIMEAFQTSGEAFIRAENIIKARQSTIKDLSAPLIMGVDPARNRDRTAFVFRRGREMISYKTYRFETEDLASMEIAGKVVLRIERMKPAKVFIDIGEGWGVVDRLRELGYGQIVQGVAFGSKALDENLYINKRVEMWSLMRDWLHREDGEVSIPDSDEIQQDLTSMPEEGTTSNGKAKLVSKKEIKKVFGKSPDIGDALALTFAFPVRSDSFGAGVSKRFTKKQDTKSVLKTLRRIRKSSRL